MRNILIALFIICSVTLSAVPVTWTNPVSVSISGNSVTCLVSNSWSAGAFSVQSIAANSNGYFEMTAQETNTYRMAGLSSTDINASYSTIQYAVYLVVNATIQIYESGNYIGSFGNYATGDVFRVHREGNQVKYYQNNNLFYTSGTLTTSALYADSGLYTYGGTIYNAHIVQVPEPASIMLVFCCFLFAVKAIMRKK